MRGIWTGMAMGWDVNRNAGKHGWLNSGGKGMRNVVYVLLMATLLLGTSHAQTAPNPQGWSQLVEAVRVTQPKDLQTLNGKRFELRAEAAAPGDSLSVYPVEAFRVERVDAKTFRVTIIDAAKLFDVEQDLLLPLPIGWQLVIGNIDPSDAALEGTPYCDYLVRFRQKGGHPLDLSKYDDSYLVKWEFNNANLVDESIRQADGIHIKRAAAGTGDLKVKLSISRQAPKKFEVASDWVAVPTCSTPINTRVATEESADSCIKVQVRSIDYCKGQCGALSVTAKAYAQNVCSRRVKCTDMVWTLNDGNKPIARQTWWVDLGSGQETFYDVPLSATYQPAKFAVLPGAGVCQFN